MSARDGTLGCPVDSHPFSASVTGKGFLKLSELLVEGDSLLWAGSGLPPRLLLGLPPLREHSGCAFYLQFIQWNIQKSGLKVSEYSLPSDAMGSFVLSGYRFKSPEADSSLLTQRPIIC